MHSVTRFTAVAAALAAAVLLALPALAAAPTTPKATLLLEVTYLKASQFQRLYALYGPKFKAACPYSKWLPGVKKAQPGFKNVTIRVTKQTITGSRALLDYQYVVNGKAVHTSRGDLYVKIGTGWYDEFDRVTTC